MKKIIALFLAVLMVFTLAACNKSASVVGTYGLTAASQNGEEIPFGEEAVMYIVLNEDGSGTYGPEGSPMNITWSQEDNTVTLIAEDIGPDDPLVMTFDGETLSATTDGLALVFTKQ